MTPEQEQEQEMLREALALKDKQVINEMEFRIISKDFMQKYFVSPDDVLYMYAKKYAELFPTLCALDEADRIYPQEGMWEAIEWEER